MASFYRDDLAFIHDAGFGELAESAAPAMLAELRRAGLESGTVVDLGCGSGRTARLLCDAGYSVIGVDLSEAMIAIARQRVPEAVFSVESFVGAALPACVGVTAIGEVFGYAFDERHGMAALENVLRRIHSALVPGGLLMFDMAGPARVPAVRPQRSFVEGDEWAVLVETDADDAHRRLTRRIVTFKRHGGLFRRSAETHHLVLVEPEQVLHLLRRTGFDGHTMPGYGETSLPAGLVAFLAQKPSGCAATRNRS